MAIVGEAHVIVKAITTGFQRQINNAVQNANLGAQGSAAGKAFSRNFSSGASSGFSKFAAEAEQARERLTQLTRAGYFVGPAISAAATALSSLVSGLFAMSSQIMSALPSLIVLPSIFTAMGQAMLTAKLAFSGVGKAIGALNKGTKGGVDRMPAILERIAAAQRRLEVAERRVTRSTEALTEAREKAREALEQLSFDSEDAALKEKKASLELEKARKTLLRVQDLPPNSAARKEAELAYQEAELEYRRAVDTNKDLAKEAKDRIALGVEGSKEVLQAIENRQDAIYEETQAEKDLAKALLEKKKAQKGGGGGGGSDPLEGLSKEAAAFAKFIASLKPEFDKLKASAGKDLFPALEIAIGNLATKLFPMLNVVLRETGKSLGIAAIDFSNIFTEASNLANINRVADTNRDTIEKLGTVVGNLASAFLSVLAAADPLVRRFTDWIVLITGGWKATAELNRESGVLTDKFNGAGDAAAQIGRILGNLYTAIRDIGRAASGPGSGGQMLMDSFEGATQKFEDFVKKISADGSLQQYFRDIVPTFESIGRFIVAIGKEFAKLGDNKGTDQLIDSLTKVVPIFGGMLDTLSESTPALGKFIESFALVLANFTESGSINVFFDILTRMLDVIDAVFGNETVKKVFGVLAVIKAVMISISTVAAVFGFFGKAVAGTIFKIIGFGNAAKGAAIATKLWNAAKNSNIFLSAQVRLIMLKEMIVKKASIILTKTLTVVTKALGIAMKVATGKIGLVILAIAAVIAILVTAYKRFDWFRNFVDAVFNGIKDVIGAVIGWVADNWQVLLTILTGPFGLAISLIVSHWDTIKNAISFVWNNVIKPVFEAFGTVFAAVWDGILLYYTTVWGVITTGISFVWNNVIKPVFEAFGTVFGKVWSGIKTAFTAVWDFIKGAIEKGKSVFTGIGTAIKDAFKEAFNFVADIWNKTIGKIGFKTPSWLGPLGGKEFKIPSIPKLAEGGIVPATRGGMTAIIGEGGRPERVEPLDPDGLSKRDKAIIAMLSGGSGGSTINVYPSPGMDEVELASLVNRQIAFQLRKGAA
jgi:phage-related protein